MSINKSHWDHMKPRIYLSNIRPGWTFQRQEGRLDEAIPGWRSGAVFRDEVNARQRKAHSPEALIDRRNMLRPHSRRTQETVAVAAVSVLAWTLGDFLAVLGRLADRNATLWAVDEGLRLPPGAGAAEVAAASHVFERAMRRSGNFGKPGGQVSGENRAAIAKAKCEAMKPYWGLPSKDYPTAALLKRFDVSKPTALAYLGIRAEAQLAHKRSVEATERNLRRSNNEPT